MSTSLWFSNFLAWSIQVAVLIAVAAILARVLRLRQPRVLLAQWRILSGLVLLLPVIEPWRRPQAIAGMLPPPAADLGRVLQGSPAAQSGQIADPQIIGMIVAALILAGIAVRIAIFASGLLKLRQLRHSASPIDREHPTAAVLEHARAKVAVKAEFRLSQAIASPVTFGFRSPLVLLPEQFLSIAERFQFAIACHELMHVRRKDWVHHLLEEAVRVVLWFHPAVLWLVGRIRLAREQVVDFEVVALTQSRKHYLEALLEFVSSRSPLAAISAPLFLIESQFAERLALLVKEIPMSRKRFVGSLIVTGCVLALTIVLGATIVPMTAATQLSPEKALGGASAQAPEPVVSVESIWTDKVKQGPMPLQVRGEGTLTRAGDAPVASVEVAEETAKEIQVGQSAAVAFAQGGARGRVSRVGSAANGMRSVVIAIDSPLPAGVLDGSPAKGIVEVGKLENVLYIGRPVNVSGDSQASLFKVGADRNEAERVKVQLGRASVSYIQVLGGLKAGDTVILSDMSAWSRFDHVQLKH